MPISITLLAIGVLLVLTKPTRFAGLMMLTLLSLMYSTVFFVVLAVGVVVYFLFIHKPTSKE